MKQMSADAIVVMGVSGCGKSTVSEALARALGWQFLDGDDFHPAANVEKMRQGQPLVDADRWPWLDTLNGLLKTGASQGQPVVLACSALREVYRARLAQNLPRCRFVHLIGSPELIAERMAKRQHLYMPASLLASQFATLETPQNAISVTIDQPIEQLVLFVEQALRQEA
jgi:gluconokinase